MSQEFPNNKEISPSNNFTNEEINLIRQVFSRKAQMSPDLMNKVKEHPFHQKFGSLAFFPKVYELLDAGEEVSMFNLNSPTRKHALKVVSGNESFVIKTLENPNEREIALRAGDLGVGPKQFDTIDGFLTEEWLDGNLIVKLDEAFCTPDRMKSIGKKIKEALLLLHGSDIVVNDQLLTDDFGKSHTIINGEGEVKFIDFGASFDVSKYPDLNDDELYCIMRSDPWISMEMYNKSEEQIQLAIDKFRTTFLRKYPDKDSLKAIDYSLLGEGVNFLASRGTPNCRHLISGFDEE